VDCFFDKGGKIFKNKHARQSVVESQQKRVTKQVEAACVPPVYSRVCAYEFAK
jgi:hypothetical protein